MVICVSTLIFSVIHLLPGDPVLIILGEQATADSEVIEQIRKKLKLDLPLIVQYYEWVKGIVHLDFGVSLLTGFPVIEELTKRISRSLELILFGLSISIAIGIPVGVLGARYPNALIGWLSSSVAILGLSAPIFVTGIVFIIAFSLVLRFLPSSGYISPTEDMLGHLLYAVLPSLSLGFGFMGVVIRMTRASLLDVLNKDYIRTARAKGLSENIVLYRHALFNALVPVIAIVGVRAGNLLGGMVIVESLFNWPGLSSMLVQSCYDRDYPMIQGALLSIFVMFVLISLTIDLCHGFLDPRIRYK